MDDSLATPRVPGEKKKLIRIMVADDHPLIRQALKLLLRHEQDMVLWKPLTGRKLNWRVKLSLMLSSWILACL